MGAWLLEAPASCVVVALSPLRLVCWRSGLRSDAAGASGDCAPGHRLALDGLLAVLAAAALGCAPRRSVPGRARALEAAACSCFSRNGWLKCCRWKLCAVSSCPPDSSSPGMSQ